MMIFTWGYWERIWLAASRPAVRVSISISINMTSGWQSTVFITASYPFWTAATTSSSLSFSRSLWYFFKRAGISSAISTLIISGSHL